MTPLFVVTTCRSRGRLLMASTIVEFDDDDPEIDRLLSADLARHAVADDALEPPPPPAPVLSPLEAAELDRAEFRRTASWEHRTSANEVEIDQLHRLVAELRAHLSLLDGRH